MIYKAYIGKQMFLLPMKENKLFAKVPRLNSKYAINKENYHRRFEVSMVDNENVIVEKQYTNIFLLNLLFHVLNVQEKVVENKQNFNNSYIIAELSKLIDQPLEGKPYAEIENLVSEYVETKKKTVETCKSSTNTEEMIVPEEKEVYETNQVEFNMNWLRERHKELMKGESE
ncbi:hypothetical protein [Enterococcus sp. DIV0206e]|uniref:hypothetical protein n=1 Tax=Enterococcus sp. DIV0206e TaxID=2774690 RepID=UPI002EA6E054|nr:hypothetical protein [Enterococcus faecium]